MAELVMILGESGNGKSTSIRNMPHEETFIIQCTPKMLPFKGGNKYYKVATKESPEGNMYVTDKYDTIMRIMDKVSSDKKFKYLIIDDFQYQMLNSFTKQLKTKVSGGDAFEKYNILASEYMAVVDKVFALREDLIVILMSHCEFDDFGNIKIKTVGKLVSEKIKPEGKTSICLLAKCNDNKYTFVTNGVSLIKSPMGMFEQTEIDNDLNYVMEQIKKYKDEN